MPRPEQLAQRVCHETLHAVVGSKDRAKEEECDVFCAAEEAAAAVGQCVQQSYPQHPSHKTYAPVGCTLKELAARTGITY